MSHLSGYSYLLPSSVRIVEVGPRDGLQNEPALVPLEVRLNLIRLLEAAGLKSIEVASFVSPKWVPQMAGSDELVRRLTRSSHSRYSSLVPNMKGLEAALDAGCQEIAVFGSASEAFSQKNINCSVRESVEKFRSVAQEALANGLSVRGYVSCIAGCPYSGDVLPSKVAEVAMMLHDLGCYEISLGDTIGAGTPQQIQQVILNCIRFLDVGALAGHYHDTAGMAVVNVYASLEVGMSVFDSSIGGLGGCPYSLGASGNVSTEDLVYLFDGLGISTGIDLVKLRLAATYIQAYLDDARTHGATCASST